MLNLYDQVFTQSWSLFFLAQPVDVELISVFQPLTVSVSQTSELHISTPGTI